MTLDTSIRYAVSTYDDRDKDLCCAVKSLKLADPVKVRHRTRIAMPESMDLVLYCESKDSFAYQGPQATVGKLMNNRYLSSRLFLSLLVAIGIISATGVLVAQDTDRSWMNSKLSPEERAELALKQMTLDEKLALLHGNGMAHNPKWTMPLTHLANGGAGYVEGVERLGIPPLVISDAAYGVRDSGANGRYSTAMPSSLGATSSWDVDSACEFGTVIGQELRAQGFNMTLGGGGDLAREPRNGRSFEYAGEDPLLAGTVVGNLMKC